MPKALLALLKRLGVKIYRPSPLLAKTWTLATGEENPNRRFRHIVYGAYFGLVGLVCFYLVISVAAWLYQRQRAQKSRPPIGEEPKIEELWACQREVESLFRDVSARYHEISQQLTREPVDVMRRIRTVQGEWRRRWREVGRYCRFVEMPTRSMPPAFQRLAAVYLDLEELDIGYAALLTRFGRHLAPRVDEIRRALESSRHALEETRRALDQETDAGQSGPVLPIRDAGAPLHEGQHVREVGAPPAP